MAGKLFRLLEKYFEPVLIVALVSGMTALIGVQIVLRLFGAALPEAEEIARYLFVWAMYLSISYAIREQRHIRIAVLVDRLPAAARLFVDNCVDIIFLLYSIAVASFGWQLIRRSLELGQIAPATQWPIAALYGSVLVGAVLCIARLSMRIAQRIYGAGQKPDRGEAGHGAV